MEDPEQPLDQYQIAVFWLCDNEKLKSEDLKNAQYHAMALKVNRMILITNGSTAFARKGEKETQVVEYEVFSLDDLQVNITKHMLVPPHSVLSQD